MPRLGGGGSRAVLAGTGSYQCADISKVPAVVSTLADFGQVLIDKCGFEQDNLQVVVDPANPADLGTALAAEAERAEDVIFFYYVGHGLTSPGGELYLGTRATDPRPNRLAHTSLAYAAVRDCLLDSPARAIVVMLDCCFSGRAVGVLGDSSADTASSARVEGGFVLTASAREEVALAPPGARHTAFTGELLRLLTKGESQGPAELTLQHICRYLSRELPAKGYPRPRYHSNATVGDLVVVSNPAFNRAPAPAPARAASPAANEGTASDVCPYPGLAAFQPDDATWFFGREQLTADLAERLADPSDCPGPLMVTGPSGSGKSSLLRAGLIPALKRGVLPLRGSASWPVLLFTPSTNPLGELAARLADTGGLDPDDSAARLAADPEAVVAVIHEALVHVAGNRNVSGARMVLIVDQFEEIFTMCGDNDQRQAFVSALCRAARPLAQPRDTAPALVILGMRADFFGHCAAISELIPVLQDGQLVVGPMTRKELCAAITEPAAAVDLNLEAGLTEILLRDLGAGGESRENESAPRSLPLLAHALRGTWQQRSGGQLTVEGYQRTGGINGAVAKSADRTYQRLEPGNQAISRLLLLRLVHLGEGTEDTRRRADRTELIGEFSDTDAVSRILDVFAQARLITLGENTVEITHEALLWHWPLLREWINADRAGFLLRQQITEAANAWNHDGRDPSALYRGTRLAAARTWADSGHRDDLTPMALEFLDASTHQVRAEQRATRRHTRHLYQLLVVMSVLALVAAGFAGWGMQQREVAKNQSNLDVSSRVGLEADQILQYDPALARQLGVAALQSANTAEARSSLIDSSALPSVTRLPAVNGSIQSATVCGSRHLLIVASGTSTVRMWNVQTPQRPIYRGQLIEPDLDVDAVSCSPNGKTLAVTSGNQVQIWNVLANAKLTHIRNVATQGSEVSSVAFSPDGRLISTGNVNGAVLMWNLTNPVQQIKTQPSLGTFNSAIYSLAFSEQGNLLAAATPGQGVQLWNITNTAHPRPLALPADSNAYSVAFSPNGNFLAAAGVNDTVSLWNISSSFGVDSVSLPDAKFQEYAQSVAISPDGRFLAAGSADRTVRVWNIADRDLVAALPYPDQLTALAFDNDTLVTGDIDGVTRLWELPGPSIQEPPNTETTAVAVSPDGHILATANTNAKIRLWDIRDRQDPKAIGEPLTGPFGYISAVSFSPAGHLLAAGTSNGTWIWENAGLSDLPPQYIPAPAGGVNSLAFNRDGTLLAVAENNQIQVWSTAHLGPPTRVGGPITAGSVYVYVDAVAFNPQTEVLAAGTSGGDNQILLWNLDRPGYPAPMRPLSGPASSIESIAFDAEALAVGCTDGTVWLWRVGSNGEPIRPGRQLIGAVGEVTSLDISGYQRMLTAGSTNGDVWLWDISNPKSPYVFATLTSLGARTHGVAFVPDSDEMVAGGATSNIPIWDISPASTARSICSSAGYQLTQGEWDTYFPNRTYSPPCG